MRPAPRPKLSFGSLHSPIGPILVACCGSVACAFEFELYQDRMLAELRARYPDFRRVEMRDAGGICARLRAYFAGRLDALDGIAVDAGGTAFQRLVWAELRHIRPGEIVTYGELARRLGIPNAVRAVGYANSLNPVNIVVPCHRVVGANGSLTGYSGGLQRKAWLLKHEGMAVKQRGLRLARR